jgi:hypothetical protein
VRSSTGYSRIAPAIDRGYRGVGRISPGFGRSSRAACHVAASEAWHEYQQLLLIAPTRSEARRELARLPRPAASSRLSVFFPLHQ